MTLRCCQILCLFYQKSVPVKLTNEYGRGAVLLFMKMVWKYWFVLYRICCDERNAWEG